MKYNQCFLMGRTTSDVTLSKAGKSVVAKFTLAINRDKSETTDFINCESWGKTAENLVKYVKKGNLLFVSGSLIQNRWQRDGKNYSVILVRATEFQLLEMKQKREESDVVNFPNLGIGLDDDIPF